MQTHWESPQGLCKHTLGKPSKGGTRDAQGRSVKARKCHRMGCGLRCGPRIVGACFAATPNTPLKSVCVGGGLRWWRTLRAVHLEAGPEPTHLWKNWWRHGDYASEAWNGDAAHDLAWGHMRWAARMSPGAPWPHAGRLWCDGRRSGPGVATRSRLRVAARWRRKHHRSLDAFAPQGVGRRAKRRPAECCWAARPRFLSQLCFRPQLSRV